jgi:hypothetical protein
MYGSGIYAQETYGGDESGAEALAISVPVISLPFTVHAPVITHTGEQHIAPPLVSNAFQVFAPDAVTQHGRPIAEDIRVMSVRSAQPSGGFNTALGSTLYNSALERERRVLFGSNAVCTLYSVSPGGGEQIVLELPAGWSARRIPTIEDGAPEAWRLEITDDRIDWNTLKNITKVRLRGATDEEQTYVVLERYNAMKPGHVYQIRMQMICNVDPS